MDFSGKVAIVTGGASGIGEACARRLASLGAFVAVADINHDRAKRTAEEISRSGYTASAVSVDVSSSDEVARAVRQVVDLYGSLDLAVNNAGVMGSSNPTGEYEVEAWREVINVNLSGVFYCMRHEIPQMLKSGGGAIVNTASNLGLVALPNAPAYVSAKHAVIGLTKAAAVEYADSGIRINAVAPALIRTPMITRGLSEEEVFHFSQTHPMRRSGDPTEVASLICWLLSDEASFVTGSTHPVDGGYLAK